MKEQMIVPAVVAAANGLDFPPFRPRWGLANGHAQTLAGVIAPGRQFPYQARQHVVPLPDGDAVVLHDDAPTGWQLGDRIVLMIHGLGGTHASSYLNRIAGRLNERGCRTFRIDLRGCGAAEPLAKLPYHSGRSEDAAASIDMMRRLCPDSPITLAGFSLGANITLKLLGEYGDQPPAELDSAVAVSPPIDLAACVDLLAQTPNQIYDQYFVRSLYRHIMKRKKRRPDLPLGKLTRRPTKLLEFDDLYTAPVSGYSSAWDYYAKNSAAPLLMQITVPTFVLVAHDDPVVPIAPIHAAERAPCVLVEMTDHGGHLGFLGRAGTDPDGHWMDWRVLDWIARFPGSRRHR